MESSNSNTNHSDELPATSSSGNQSSIVLDLSVDDMPRRRIIPRRRGGSSLLSLSRNTGLPSISIVPNPSNFSDNNTSTNSQNQNSTLSVPPLSNESSTITNNIQAFLPPPIEEDSDDDSTGEELPYERIFRYAPTRYPTLSSNNIENEFVDLGFPAPARALHNSSRSSDSVVLHRGALPLFPRRLASTMELMDRSDSDSDEDDMPTFRFEAAEEEEPLFMRNLISQPRNRHQNEDEREEFERHRLEQFQNRLDSMISYGDEEKDEQEEQTSTTGTDRTHTDTTNSIDSADSSQDENVFGEYDDTNLLRTSVLNRFRRRIFGDEVSSVFHRQRIEKMMNDRFAYFWSVIHNWNPKTPLRTGYLRYHFIPPRK